MNSTVAYRHCARVTRSRAANFYYGIRLLPLQKRNALCAVYAFARRVDDIGDGSLPAAEKSRRLDLARRSLDHPRTTSDDPVLAAIAHASSRFPISFDRFRELIDGVEMDVGGAAYRRFDDLLVYCRRVAGTIGQLSVSVFGASDTERSAGLADDLGVAMQLTNILRDVREDRLQGRVYLPAEDLERFGCPPDLERARPDAVASLIRFEAARGRRWFDRGLRLVPLLDGRSAACVRAMTGIYLRVLAKVERSPQVVLRTRVSLAPWEKAWVAASSLTASAARHRPDHREVEAAEVSS
jgi:15-cis-phytoene synthase